MAVVTGHEDPSKPDASIDWKRLATATDTLVCLMGVATLATTAQRLMRHGRPGDTPCAMIEWGTTVRQRTVTGTLATIAARAQAAAIRPPAILVVGEVVRLRERLNWFERQPLFGRRVLVTRPAARASELSRRLEAVGAEAVELPAVELAAVRDRRPFRAAVAELPQTDWVFFTSPEGIDWFTRLLRPLHRDLRVLQGCHIGAIGAKTAEAIRARGLHVDVTPATFSQEGLLDALSRRRLRGTRALIFCAASSRDVLEQGLRRLGMTARRVPMYDTKLPSSLITRVRRLMAFDRGTRRGARAPVDVVTVTSASGVDHLAAAFAACGRRAAFRRLPFASIGPVTSHAVRRHGGSILVEASTSTIEGLVEAMAAALRPAGQRGARA
jgi:uroporphyrinogen III methyltransferase/synthase